VRERERKRERGREGEREGEREREGTMREERGRNHKVGCLATFVRVCV